MKFVDAHVHLSDEEYSDSIGELMDETKSSNVVSVVSNSMDLKTSLGSIKLAKEYSGTVYAALGIHPWTVNDLREDGLQQMLGLISEQRQNRAVVAVGEIGLDHKYAKIWDKQLMVFNKMLHAAEKLDLPVIIHSRGTAEQIVEMLPSFNIKKVLLHWFSNPVSVLSKIVEKGYYVSEGPSTAYSNGIREVVRRMPLNNLLTETDGPVCYRKKPFNGKKTTSAFIPIVVRAIAEIKKMSEIDVSEQIIKNFEEFFRVKLN